MNMENEAPRALTLEQFCNQIRYVVEQNHLESWVTAEIAQVNQSHGHYYLELVQKSEHSDSPSAKLRCNIWSSMAHDVLSPIRQATGGELETGMKIMAYVRATFHPVYGLSGLICAIDPTYTLGDLEARRQAILKQLMQDGVLEMNKEFALPSVIKNIAIISAETAAGYGDFINQLGHNAYDIVFHTTLYPAMMQGTGAEDSIVDALERIANVADKYDVVVIIRGGGSKMDLACFDSYKIASNVAQFPLPVITGIGHERDRSITDLVAHTSVKTPTAVAEFIISHDADFLQILDNIAQRVKQTSQATVEYHKSLMDNLSVRLMAAANNTTQAEKSHLDNTRTRIVSAANFLIAEAKHTLTTNEMRISSAAQRRTDRMKMTLDNTADTLINSAERLISRQRERVSALEMRVKSADPRNIMARGYSVTTDANGRRITSRADVAAGSEIVTHLVDGAVKSVVK